ncbi:MAG: methionyl-tRNA formyltransferase [Bdellovibrionales bacterium]
MTPASKLRLAFMGTPDFAVLTLLALRDAGHDIAAVYSQPPRAAGRGQKIQKSPVHAAAEDMGILVRTPRSLRDTDEQKFFGGLDLDCMVVVAYGLILPPAILDAPRLGCINIHFSLLPRWRGAAPVQRAMLAGDAETGVDIMQMDAGLDTGPILMREKVAIPPAITAGDLLKDLSARGAQMTLKVLAGLASGSLKASPQPETGITHAAKLSREDGRIDWTMPATDIERRIRALQPWPGCFFMLGNEAIKLQAAQVMPGISGRPGTLLDEDFTVACGTDSLRLLTVQKPGKGPTDGTAFIRGARLGVGHVL